MNASNAETIYSAGSGDWTQARLITVSGSARTVPMSHRDNHRSPRVADRSLCLPPTDASVPRTGRQSTQIGTDKR